MAIHNIHLETGYVLRKNYYLMLDPKPYWYQW